MFSIGKVKSSTDVHAYFVDKDNYYLSDTSEIKEGAIWYGQGAESLGIIGEKVEESLFLSLLEGRMPNGEQIGQMRDGSVKHRPATDLTFSAPKSISVMALVHGDRRLVEIHNQAVEVALAKVESLYAEARKTVNGATTFEKTGNLTIARFRHTTSRELDPQLHTHGVTLNITQREDGLWRALSSRKKTDIENIEHGFRENIFAHQHYIGMVYNSVLAKGAVDLGYSIRVTDKYGNFEIEGIPQDYLDSQSKRRTQIKTMLDETGNSGAKAAQVAALASRERKEEVDMESLKAYWQENAKQVGVDLEAVYLASRTSKIDQKTINTNLHAISHDAREAIGDAVAHLSQYAVQMSHGDIIRQGFIFGGGTVEHEQLENAVTQLMTSGELIGRSNNYYTTRLLVDTEKALKKQISAAKGVSYSIDVARSGIVAATLKNSDRLQIVNTKGIKNEAKLVDDMVKTAENNDLNVFVLHHNRSSINRLRDDVRRDSTTTWAVFKNYLKHDLLQTVSSFKQDYQHGLRRLFERTKKDYIVVTDAQKMSYKDVKELDALALKGDAKVIFLNNTESTQGFRAGNSIKLLKEAGVAVHVSTTARKNSTIELTRAKSPQQSLVDTYLSEKGRPTIVVSTNKDQKMVTTTIREKLKNQGELSVQEISYKTLSTKGLSDVQKTKIKFYAIGDQVTLKPFTKNQETYHVQTIDSDNNRLILKDRDGRKKRFSLESSDNVEVKKQQTLPITIGEQLRATRGIYIDGRTRIEKNTVFEVIKMNNKGVQVQVDGKKYRLNHDKLADSFIDHAYVVKPHQLTDTEHVLTALEGYQINANSLGEISEYAKRVTLLTNDTEKSAKLLDRQNQAWLATDVASGNANNYKPVVRTDESIKNDLEVVVLALSGNEKVTADTAVAYGMAKLGEREAGFEMSELLKESMQYAIGQVTSDEIELVVKQKQAMGEILTAGTFVTTKAAYEIESRILHNNKEGQGSVTSVYTAVPALREFLTQGQKDAVYLALTTKDRFVAVQGWAGTGKTTMMEELLLHAQKGGYQVIGIAPTHKAVQKLSESMNTWLASGAIPVMTASRFLGEDVSEFSNKTIVIADEASMLSNRQFLDIQEKVKAMDARGIFSGDINQQSAIPSGKPMELSLNNGLNYATMAQIVRQKTNPALKEAIELASSKKVVASLKKLEPINPQIYIKRKADLPTPTLAPTDAYAWETQSFIEVGVDKNVSGEPVFLDNGLPSLQDLYSAIANDYLTRIPEQRDRTIVVASMHQSREAIDGYIREGLKKEGIIQNEIPATRLRSRNLTEAETLNVKNFKSGDVLKFATTYSVVKSGDHMTVMGIKAKTNQLQVVGKDKHIYTVNPASIALKTNMTVHEKIETHLGIGDRVRLRATDLKRGWKGGAEYKVNELNDNKAILANGDDTLTLDLNKKHDQHWDHAYTNTTFSVQGDDDKYDIGVAINDNCRTILIQMSRASHQSTIYTASKSWLIHQLEDIKKQQAADKVSAIEIMSKTKQATPELNRKAKASNAKTVIQQEKKVSAAEIKPLLDARIEELAQALLGDPNKKLSDRSQLRFGSKGSVSVNLRTGQWYSHEAGKGGGAFELIKSELGMTNFNDVMEYAKKFVNYHPDIQQQVVKNSLTPTKKADVEDKARKTQMKEYANTLFSKSVPLEKTLGEVYLRIHRGLSHIEQADIRYLNTIPGYHNDKKIVTPAIVAFAKDDKGEINHVQVIRLDHNGKKNKDVSLAKQTYGSITGHAVELNKQSTEKVTYLAEGIETGLSILSANRKAQVLAVLGKSNFANIDLSKLADKVVLCLDNDGIRSITDKTINDAIVRIESSGKEVRVVMPKIHKYDFNDVLVKQGHNELKNQVNQLVTPDEYRKIVKNYAQTLGTNINKNIKIDLDESVKKLRLNSGKALPFNFDDKAMRTSGRGEMPVSMSTINKEVGMNKQLDRDVQHLTKNANRADAVLKKQLEREQVENIASQSIEKSQGREKER